MERFVLILYLLHKGEKSWSQRYKWVGSGGGQTCEDVAVINIGPD